MKPKGPVECTKQANICIMGVSNREEGEKGVGRILQKINSQLFPKFDKSTNPRSSTNSKKGKLKEAHTETHHNQTAERQRRRKKY